MARTKKVESAGDTRSESKESKQKSRKVGKKKRKITRNRARVATGRPKVFDEKDFIQWQNLVHCVIRERFFWSYNVQPELRNIKRTVSYDDLFQEGCIALQRAWVKYDGTREDAASFKTYAYAAIFRRIGRWLSKNYTPVTIKNWAKCSVDPKYKGNVAAALGCVLFSEGEAEDPDKDWAGEISDRHGDSDITDVDHWDYVKRCTDLLKKMLTRREYGVLIDKQSGKTYEQIATRRQMTRDQVRKLIAETMVKAASILKGRGEHREEYREGDSHENSSEVSEG